MDKGTNYSEQEKRTISEALQIMEGRMVDYGQEFVSSDAVSAYLKLKLSEQKNEVFAVLFLNIHNQLIEYRELFTGTIDSTRIYSRNIAQVALELNAASVILAHNHPSGNSEPSPEDVEYTNHIVDALQLVGVEVVDHIVIGGMTHTSFCDRNLMPGQESSAGILDENSSETAE